MSSCMRQSAPTSSRGACPAGEKLPSKRALAEHLSLSKITVETAYAQLLDEGYLTSRERSGYFVAHMPLLAKAPARYAAGDGKSAGTANRSRTPRQSCFRFPCGQS